MAKYVVVTDDKDLNQYFQENSGYQFVTVSQYINQRKGTEKLSLNNKSIRVINLCNNSNYLTSGYYVSLLAEARGQKVIPSVNVLLDLNWKKLYQKLLPELNEALNKEFKAKDPSEKSFYIFLGKVEETALQNIARKIFKEFRSPILSVKIYFEDKEWHIEDIEPISIKKLNQEQKQQFIKALENYNKGSWRNQTLEKPNKYYLAILFDEDEEYQPSSLRTINKFIKIAESLDIDAEIIDKNDYNKISEYDGLFLRETTAIDNHTYRFAKKAEKEGVVVIDDSKSIMRCTNKVYLAELLQANKIPTPKTTIFDKSQFKKLQTESNYPIVLKIPDESNSKGVYKANNAEEFDRLCQELFKKSDLILTQEFMQTEFDWRVGILNNTPLFVCQYFMARHHWQIIKNKGDKALRSGKIKNIKIEDTPKGVIDIALKATKLIGNGFYGVDLKQTKDGIFVIEINDNPSINSGDEDSILQDELYKIILREFIRRIEQ